MKKILSMLFLTSLFASTQAQTGTTCNNAISITPTSTCSYSSYTTGGTEMWFKFVASSPTLNISVVTTKFGINAPHIHNIALISGTCSGQTVIAEDELSFVYDADKLAIDLNASGLTIGNTYYIRADREATHTACDKLNCKLGGSTSPSAFNICVENINVIIPADFGLEAPSSAYSYLTNRGQLLDVNNNPVPDVKLYTLNANPNLYISSDKVSYVFSRIDTIDTTPDTLHKVDMTLVGANTGTKVFKTETVQGNVNFFLPHIPNGVTGNKSYSRSVSNEVYPNIDMQCYSNSLGEKFYFVVRPGGDANNIVFKFDGATAVTALANGGLKVTTPLGNIEYEAPHAYQINAGGNVVPMPWQANFLQVTANSVKFDIRSYPHNMPLFIQVDKGHKAPVSIQNITWSTFFGGGGNDELTESRTDANGNLYIAGISRYGQFPTTPGVYQGTNGGNRDALALKFNPLGQVIWATYIGGSGVEIVGGIAVDASGNVFIAGNTQSSDFPTSLGNPGGGATYYPNNASTGGFSDGFIVKFAPDGITAPWRTYYGGSANEYFDACRIDASGNLFIVGQTSSSDFPRQATGSQYNQTCISGGAGDDDGVILKFNNAGVRQWGACYGGASQGEYVNELDFDTSGNLFVVGTAQTPGTGFPTLDLPGSTDMYYGTLQGTSDAFIAKFDNSGVRKYASLFGGNGSDYGGEIVTNSSGEIFVAGTTGSSNLPVLQNGAVYYDNTLAGTGTYDAFLLKLRPDLKQDWGSYVGGTANDWAYGLTIDNHNILYLAGYTESSDFPMPASNPPNTYNHAYNGGLKDSYISAFDVDGFKRNIWGTFIGGSKEDVGYTVVTDINNNLFVIGKTNSDSSSVVDFPLDNGGGIPTFQQYLAGGTDGSITRFDRVPITLAGVDEINNDDSGLSVYPNPTNNLLNINFTNEEKSSVTFILYNTLGEIVQSKDMGKQSGSISYAFDVTDFAEGIYFIQVQSNNKIINQKFIKQ